MPQMDKGNSPGYEVAKLGDVADVDTPIAQVWDVLINWKQRCMFKVELSKGLSNEEKLGFGIAD